MKRILFILPILIMTASPAFAWDEIVGDTTITTAVSLVIENSIYCTFHHIDSTGLPDSMIIRIRVTNDGGGETDSGYVKTAIYDTTNFLLHQSEEIKIGVGDNQRLALLIDNINDSLLHAGNRCLLCIWASKEPKITAYVYINTSSPGDTIYRGSKPYTAWEEYLTGIGYWGPNYSTTQWAWYSPLATGSTPTISYIHSPNYPAYVHSVFGGGGLGEPMPCQAVACWWNNSYLYRRTIASDTQHAIYNAEHFLKLDNVNTTGAKFQDDGDDIRIVFESYSGQIELGRLVMFPNTDSTEIYFKVVTQIPANENIGIQSDYRYYMYYGNDTATAPTVQYVNIDCIDAPYSVDDNTAALYHFEETTSDYLDETTNNNDIDSVDVTSRVLGGKFGLAPDFTYASSERLSAPDDNSLDIDSTESICLESWFKIDTDYETDDASDRMPLIGKNIPGNSTNYKLYLANNGKIAFSFYNTEWNTWITTDSFTGTGWHHAAVSYTGTEGDSIKAYMDAVLKAGSWTDADGDSSLIFNTERLGIGGE